MVQEGIPATDAVDAELAEERKIEFEPGAFQGRDDSSRHSPQCSARPAVLDSRLAVFRLLKCRITKNGIRCIAWQDVCAQKAPQT